MDHKEFYMVFNPMGGAARVRHATFDEAKQEAIRLAQANPHQDFYVLATVGVYRGVVNLKATNFVSAILSDVDVPVAVKRKRKIIKKAK